MACNTIKKTGNFNYKLRRSYLCGETSIVAAEIRVEQNPHGTWVRLYNWQIIRQISAQFS